jgi:endoglucanase
MKTLVVWGHRVSRLAAAISICFVLSACGDEGSKSAPACKPAGGSALDDFVAAPPAEIACSLGRGVNFGNMFDAPEEGLWNVHYAPELVTEVKNAGFSHIRLPVRWSNHAELSADATLDEEFATRIDEVIELALSNELFVVLDAHHYRELEGSPVDAGETAGVEPDALEDRLVNIWKQLAARYQGTSNRLLFELYNEPHARLSPEVWNALAARTLTAVREIEPERTVVLGASEWNEPEALASLEVPDDPNLIVTIHHYVPYHFTFQATSVQGSFAWLGTTCCDAEQKAVIVEGLDTAKTFAKQHALPIYLGEWGSSTLADTVSRVTYTRFVRDEAEARDFPWAIWSLIDLGIYDPSTKEFMPEMLEALFGK